MPNGTIQGSATAGLNPAQTAAQRAQFQAMINAGQLPPLPPRPNYTGPQQGYRPGATPATQLPLQTESVQNIYGRLDNPPANQPFGWVPQIPAIGATALQNLAAMPAPAPQAQPSSAMPSIGGFNLGPLGVGGNAPQMMPQQNIPGQQNPAMTQQQNPFVQYPTGGGQPQPASTLQQLAYNPGGSVIPKPPAVPAGQEFNRNAPFFRPPSTPSIETLANGGAIVNVPWATPQQQLLAGNIAERSGQRFANPYAGFEPIAARAQRQFAQSTIPSLAERFTAMGGGQRSSAFQGALGQAGSELESQLAQIRAQYGQQQEQQALQEANLAMTPLYNQEYVAPFEAGREVARIAQTGGQAASDLFRSAMADPNDNWVKQGLRSLGSAFGFGGQQQPQQPGQQPPQAGPQGQPAGAAPAPAPAPAGAPGAGKQPKYSPAVQALKDANIVTKDGARALEDPNNPNRATMAAAVDVLRNRGTANPQQANALMSALGLPATATALDIAGRLGSLGFVLGTAALMGWIAYEMANGIIRGGGPTEPMTQTVIPLPPGTTLNPNDPRTFQILRQAQAQAAPSQQNPPQGMQQTTVPAQGAMPLPPQLQGAIPGIPAQMQPPPGAIPGIPAQMQPPAQSLGIAGGANLGGGLPGRPPAEPERPREQIMPRRTGTQIAGGRQPAAAQAAPVPQAAAQQPGNQVIRVDYKGTTWPHTVTFANAPNNPVDVTDIYNPATINTQQKAAFQRMLDEAAQGINPNDPAVIARRVAEAQRSREDYARMIEERGRNIGAAPGRISSHKSPKRR